jgi:alkylhydroperoxidase family enzyme
MARICLILPEAMNDEQHAQFRRFPANLTRALLRTGASTSAYLSLAASFARGLLSAKDRELAILRVGALSQSKYERMQHLGLAKQAGWTDEQIAAIEEGDQMALGARECAILRFVDECVYRVRVSDSSFLALKKLITEQEIAEITLLVGHYMMTARFLETIDVDLDDEPTPWSSLLS